MVTFIYISEKTPPPSDPHQLVLWSCSLFPHLISCAVTHNIYKMCSWSTYVHMLSRQQNGFFAYAIWTPFRPFSSQKKHITKLNFKIWSQLLKIHRSSFERS